MLRFAPLSLLALALFATPVLAQENGQEKRGTVVVTARGTASVAPDMAVVNLAVRRDADTAREALDAANRAMAGVLAAMKARGIAERDLQTSRFDLQPRIVYPEESDRAPRVVSYTVTNGLTVRLRDISQLGAVMDEAVTLGINTGGGITFTNADADAPREAARVDAVERAVAKARTLVEAAGAKLGPIVSIREGRSVQIPQPRAMARAQEASAVPIATGETDYAVTVTIEWALDQ